MSQEDPTQRIWVRNTDWYRPLTRWLRDLPRHKDPRVQSFFSFDTTLVAARAPGRLDVMGGIAGYNGSLVLELPMARATYAVLQKQEPPVADLMTLRGEATETCRIDIGTVRRGDLDTPEAIRARFAASTGDRWAARIVGLLHYLFHKATLPVHEPVQGFRLLVLSDVPPRRGAGASAALEVACMYVLSAILGIDLEPGELVEACRWVENHVVGAPGGIMGQTTVVFGRQDRMLRLRCQPAQIEGYPPVPSGYQCYGIDSGERRTGDQAESGTVRTAAYMGYRMLAAAAGLHVRLEEERTVVDDPLWRGYLANLTPEKYRSRYGSVLPGRMLGRDFLQHYPGFSNATTKVDPDRVYPVRHATEYPIYENDRVQRFAEHMAELPRQAEAASELGHLMAASHAGYTACGLGSREADLLLDLLRRSGPDSGILGARIAGEGGGGIVSVFGTVQADAALRDVAEAYRKETQKGGEVFVGSSPGAAAVGLLTFRPLLFSPG